MSDHVILIPDALYEKAQRVAQQTSQHVEDVIRARLEKAFDAPDLELPADEQAELRAMLYLSDDALFTIMREQMNRAKQDRLSALIGGNSAGTLDELEHAELVALVEDGDRLMLRKANAMRILSERGYSVGLSDMTAADE